MPELKLAKLPDRSPVKIAITVSSDLNAALRQYADIYRLTYGDAEPVSELIPFMLEAFLESDREFAKARKAAETSAGKPLPASSPPESTGPSAKMIGKGG